MMYARTLLALLVAIAPVAGVADTLYPAAPLPPGGGRAMHLGADHRASQVGDLVNVVFDFAVASSSSDVSQNAKGYSVGLAPGIGNAALSFLRFPTSIGGQTGSQSTQTKNGSNTFASSMMATVVAVLPGGVMQIAGDQQLVVNGENQTMHVIGYVRPEDIDGGDSVLSTRIAGVRATFDGNFQEKHTGLIRKILNFLF